MVNTQFVITRYDRTILLPQEFHFLTFTIKSHIVVETIAWLLAFQFSFYSNRFSFPELLQSVNEGVLGVVEQTIAVSRYDQVCHSSFRTSSELRKTWEQPSELAIDCSPSNGQIQWGHQSNLGNRSSLLIAVLANAGSCLRLLLSGAVNK